MSNLTPELLQPLIEKHGLTRFVETGSYLGDGIATALSVGLSTVESCDVWKENSLKCTRRFLTDYRVRIFWMKGTDMLGMIPTEGKILFWLDGHFPGHYGYSIEYPLQFPLMEELDIIRKRFNGNNCVILCDDAWLFEDGPRHDKSPEQYRQKITVTAISELFPAHKVRVIDQQEGIVVLEP